MPEMVVKYLHNLKLPRRGIPFANWIEMIRIEEKKCLEILWGIQIKYWLTFSNFLKT